MDESPESATIVPPPERSRSLPRPPAYVVHSLGVCVLIATAAAILLAPHVMSRSQASALQLFWVLVSAAYGIYLAAHSRTTHVDLERAYSAHLEELSQRLRNMAYRDSLTGLYNHRYFYEQLSHEVERSVRYGQPLAILLMDMDNFKDVNDTCGHIVGDKFLGQVGQLLARQIRASDIAARYGGDEFVVILPNTTADEARATADKLSAAVATSASLTGVDEKVRLGISIGMACCPDDSRVPGELLQIADNRLYDAKTERPSRRPRRRGAA